MANHPSASKRHRQEVQRAVRNRGIRSALRTALKKAHVGLEKGDAKEAANLVREASIALAQAASKGVIHARNAARRTSRLALALNKLGA